MKLIFKFALFLFLGTVFLGPVLLAWKIVDTRPYVIRAAPLSREEMHRARALVQANRPGSASATKQQLLALSKKDLNLLLQYALDQADGNDRAAARIDLNTNLFIVHVTFEIPPTFLGRYINTSIGIAVKEGKPAIFALQAGSLIVPGYVARPMAAVAHGFLMRLGPYQTAYAMMDSFKQMRIDPNGIQMAYDWDPRTIDEIKSKAKQQLFSPARQKQIQTYHNLLANTARLYHNREISLLALLKPLFDFAAANSVDSNDPGGENKALLQVLAAFVTGRDMTGFMAEEIRKDMKSIPPCIPTLFNRDDLAQHLLVSAAVTVSASGRIADVIGLAKEMEDAEAGGSGFSFADLAADKAGVKLGTLAVESPDKARQLQQRMRRITKESDLMPDIKALPRPMTIGEFRERFQSTDSPAYKKVESFIENKLKRCWVLQN